MKTIFFRRALFYRIALEAPLKSMSISQVPYGRVNLPSCLTILSIGIIILNFSPLSDAELFPVSHSPHIISTSFPTQIMQKIIRIKIRKNLHITCHFHYFWIVATLSTFTRTCDVSNIFTAAIIKNS